LEKIRLDRPIQVINEVHSFKENEFGFYDVEVDMEGMFFNTKILHVRQVLPYPLEAYKKLDMSDLMKWRSNAIGLNNPKEE
jgi:hypothetical protein